jgi:hypothetical protein
MSALELIDEAKRAGVYVTLADDDTVKLTGDEDAVKRLIPAIREHKPEIVALLRGQQEHALHLAKLAVARASLTDEQKQLRIADIEQTPEIAKFWIEMYRDEIREENLRQPTGEAPSL